MPEKSTPIPIRAFIERTYPRFFDVPRRPLEVAAHLCLVLEARRHGRSFHTRVEHVAGEVRVTLIWMGDNECTFVATGHALDSALFAATLRAMNSPQCSAWFDP